MTGLARPDSRHHAGTAGVGPQPDPAAVVDRPAASLVAVDRAACRLPQYRLGASTGLLVPGTRTVIRVLVDQVG